MKYFTEQEINEVSFGCDNGFDNMNPVVIGMIDRLRERYGDPIYLSCAYRTVEHDVAKGRSGRSDHCKGNAFDIKIDSLKDAAKLIALGKTVGFNAFGISLKSGFVHIGFRPEVDGVVTWNY